MQGEKRRRGGKERGGERCGEVAPISYREEALELGPTYVGRDEGTGEEGDSPNTALEIGVFAT